jgi:hypothetical protein
LKFMSGLLMLLLLTAAARAQDARHRPSHVTLPVVSPATPPPPTQLSEQAVRLGAVVDAEQAELTRCEGDVGMAIGNAAVDRAEMQARLSGAQTRIEALEKENADLKSAVPKKESDKSDGNLPVVPQ